jgi:uncharacterized protein (DUF1697 family)
VGKVAVFLRAVNLPGGSLLMADFRRALAAAGFDGAKTVAAAGNAVITAPKADAALERAIEAAMQATLGATSEVFCRSGRELAAIASANPFDAFARDDPGHLMVVFLRRSPSAGDVAALQARIKGREQVAAGPGCLFATYPDGAGRSKLTAAMIERALTDRGTARNWNTLTRMAELAATP